MIKVQKLSKSFGSIRAVDAISFSTEPGQIVGFLGPNGAGKSTTLRMITGYLRPDAGTVHIGAIPVARNPVQARAKLGYLPENGPLYPEMTPLEYLTFAARARGIPNPESAVGLTLQRCFLTNVANQPADTLSKGYRQRLGVAQAILHNPPVLILDEPSEGLDPNQRREMRRMLLALASDKTILIATHNLSEVDAICNRIIVIAAGRIRVDESPEAFRNRHPLAHAIRIHLSETTRPIAIQTLREHDEIDKLIDDPDGGLLIIPKQGHAIDGLVMKLARDCNWHLSQIRKPRPPLDDVFAQLTKDDQHQHPYPQTPTP